MSNAASCSTWRLYVIIDRAAARQHDLKRVTEQAIRGGADVIQLRDKQATTRQLLDEAMDVLQVTRAAGVPLIINDRVDVALAMGAEGVHLGQEDLPVVVARSLLGPDRLVGKSTHSLEQALEASQEEAANYLAVGPIYPTPTKANSPSVGLHVLGQVTAQVRKPVVAIGGIDASTVPEVLAAGARCIAVVRAVCGAVDPEAAARELKTLLTQSVRAIPSSGL